MSNFKYVTTHYIEADPLKKVTYTTFIENSELQYEDDDMCEDDKFVKQVLYNHRHRTLDQFVGDTIVRMYNKKDPKDTQLWVTDCSRKRFIVREKVDGKNKWVADMDGEKVTIKLINPIMKKLKKLINSYFKSYCLFEIGDHIDTEKQKDIMDEQHELLQIKTMIEQKKLHKKVLKYIAPKFIVRKVRK